MLPQISNSEQQSDFYTAVKERFGQHLGKQVADNAVRELKRIGISPDELRTAPQAKANNAMLFAVDNLAVKIVNDVGSFQDIPPEDKVKLKPLTSAHIGFDMGNVPISLVITPLMSTKAVTSEHVKALSYELDSRGKLFRDNKLDNVALTREGLPYVIDDGAVTLRSQLSPLERGTPFIYPDLSGYDSKTGEWETVAKFSGFRWPENQMEIPEFRKASANLDRRMAKAAENAMQKG
jgi:hypothetical protein